MDKQVILAVVKHRLLGHLIVPYFAVPKSDFVIEVAGHATPLTVERRDDLHPDVKSIVDILDSLSEQRIAKSFSRGKTSKAFFDTLSEEMMKNTVRPYIDKKICEALPLIQRTQIHVYLKEDGYQTINCSDRLDIAPVFSCKPKFFFTLAESGDLLYTLKVSDTVTDIPLYKTGLIELSSSPAVFVSRRTLYSFAEAPFSKFKPFATNQRIKVDARIVDGYMRKFVLSSVKSYWVAAYGFDIIRHKVTPSVELRARQSVFGWGFEPVFIYGDVACPFNNSQNAATLDVTPAGRYVFNVTMRNRDFERRVMTFLTDEVGFSSVGDICVVAGQKFDFNDIVKWSYSHKDELLERAVNIVLSDDSTRFYFGSWDFSTQMSSSADWFDINMVVIIGNFKIPFDSFFHNISSGNNRYLLPNGEVFLIPDAWFEQWAGLIPFLVSSPDGSFRVSKRYSALLPSFMLADSPEVNPSPQSGLDISLVPPVGVEMRPYQKTGVEWFLALAEHGRGGILADDMGLGKTLQAITLLASIYASQEAPDANTDFFSRNTTGRCPSLVVMPVSLIANWQREIHRLAPSLSVYTYIAKNAITSVTLPQLLAQYHIVLTSYAHVRIYAEALATIPFECVILDESQVIKNYSSKTNRAVASLKSKVRFCLSGTPVENNLMELWAQMNFVNPGLLGSRDYFEHRYRNPIEVSADDDVMRLLKTIIRPYFLRRTKEQVLDDLPPLSIQTVECPMTDDQSDAYEREKSACRNLIMGNSDPQGRKKFMVLQALTRLRLLANHPALCLPDYEGGSGKFDIVMEHIRSITAAGHKLLLFSSFVKDMEMLCHRLADSSIPYEIITGNTPSRDEVVRRFESSDTTKVMLISLKAGGVGLNIVSASYVLILNPWWNPAAEQQAYSRAHRIGQTSAVTVYRFISSNTIEQKINALQERKLKLASDAVEVTSLDHIPLLPSDDELLQMLSD